MAFKILIVFLCLLLLVPAGLATYGWKFGDCFYDDPQGPYALDCTGRPGATGAPPGLVTGHTIYAKFVIEAEAVRQVDQKQTLGLPTDFAAIAGHFVVNVTRLDHTVVDVAAQRECVAWFNGIYLDQQPDPDAFYVDDHFPSDEDEPGTETAMQDYDFGRDVPDCTTHGSKNMTWAQNSTYHVGAFAVAVEKGDCDPAHGSGFRYRGHLDFIDPNGLYHEVQEYDYSCLLDLPKEHLLCLGEDQAARPDHPLPGGDRVAAPNDKAARQHGRTANATGLQAVNGNASRGLPYVGCGPEPGDSVALFAGSHADIGTGEHVAGIVERLFPWTYTDPHNVDGCGLHATPADHTAVAPNATDPANSTVTPGHFDLGHKCNGSLQDLFRERLWMTPVHAPQYDATIQEHYSFALQIDTCAGWNIYELFGKQTAQDVNNSSSYMELDGVARDLVQGTVGLYHEALEFPYTTLDSIGVDVPLEFVDLCADGSSFSFDDTFRGRTVHREAPGSTEDIMRGNSFDGDPASAHYGKHRPVCRDNDIDWPHNFYPRDAFDPLGLGTALTGQPLIPAHSVDQTTCYPEDHKTAFVDLYVYPFDPTGGHWALNAKGLGGTTSGVTYTAPPGYS